MKYTVVRHVRQRLRCLASGDAVVNYTSVNRPNPTLTSNNRQTPRIP